MNLRVFLGILSFAVSLTASALTDAQRACRRTVSEGLAEVNARAPYAITDEVTLLGTELRTKKKFPAAFFVYRTSVETYDRLPAEALDSILVLMHDALLRTQIDRHRSIYQLCVCADLSVVYTFVTPLGRVLPVVFSPDEISAALAADFSTPDEQRKSLSLFVSLERIHYPLVVSEGFTLTDADLLDRDVLYRVEVSPEMLTVLSQSDDYRGAVLHTLVSSRTLSTVVGLVRSLDYGLIFSFLEPDSGREFGLHITPDEISAALRDHTRTLLADQASSAAPTAFTDDDTGISGEVVRASVIDDCLVVEIIVAPDAPEGTPAEMATTFDREFRATGDFDALTTALLTAQYGLEVRFLNERTHEQSALRYTADEFRAIVEAAAASPDSEEE